MMRPLSLGSMRGVLCLIPRCFTGFSVDEAHTKGTLWLCACLDHREGSSERGKTEGDATQSYMQGLFAVPDSRHPAQALLVSRWCSTRSWGRNSLVLLSALNLRLWGVMARGCDWRVLNIFPLMSVELGLDPKHHAFGLWYHLFSQLLGREVVPAFLDCFAGLLLAKKVFFFGRVLERCLWHFELNFAVSAAIDEGDTRQLFHKQKN